MRLLLDSVKIYSSRITSNINDLMFRMFFVKKISALSFKKLAEQTLPQHTLENLKTLYRYLLYCYY